VLAPIASQPSLPFVGPAELHVSPEELSAIRARARAGQKLLGLRFTGDRFVPHARFDHLREALGDRFVAVEIDSSKGNPYGHPASAHSVLTEHLVDEPGQPTRDALEQVLDLFRTRLLSPAT
jgi:hypothetical protein